MPNNYKQYFAIEKRIKQLGYEVERTELIEEYTNGRKKGLRELGAEYKYFITWLNERFQFANDWKNSLENKMRRKVISIFIHHMGSSWKQMEEWCKQYGKHHKALNEHSHDELTDLVTQAEQVYVSYLKNLKE